MGDKDRWCAIIFGVALGIPMLIMLALWAFDPGNPMLMEL